MECSCRRPGCPWGQHTGQESPSPALHCLTADEDRDKNPDEHVIYDQPSTARSPAKANPVLSQLSVILVPLGQNHVVTHVN